ncbi:MAG: ketosynthase [Panacagrimonas sp.]|jgi:uncharacterized membrane protein|nr:hypothetical protein [Panacagrimonas sp.]MCC2657796.1 ketosynthase [Panacagrimonas sp.]
MKGVIALLVIAYAALSHAALRSDAVVLQVLALGALVAIPLLAALGAGHRWVWVCVPPCAAIIGLVVAFDAGRFVLKLPALLVPAFLFAVFGASLRPGRTALITRIATAARPSISVQIVRHTRRLTALWTLLFAAMVVASVVLLLLGRTDWWSLQTNLFNYLACAALFVGDHLYRRFRFADEPQPGFIDYLRAASGYRQWM